MKLTPIPPLPPLLRHHYIRGSEVEVKRKGDKVDPYEEDKYKYFLGGLDSSVKDEDIRDYFGR